MKFRRIFFIVASAALLSAGFALSQEVNDEVIPMPQDEVVVPQAVIDIPAWNQILEG